MDIQNTPPDITFTANDTPLMVLRKMRRLFDWKIGEGRSIGSRLRKFGEEVGEMTETLFVWEGVHTRKLWENAHVDLVDEIADVAIVLQDILLCTAERMKIEPFTLTQVMAEKLEKKRLRWLEEHRNGK